MDFLRYKQARLAVLCGVAIPDNAAKPGAEDLAKDFSAEAAEAEARAKKKLDTPEASRKPSAICGETRLPTSESGKCNKK